MLSRLPNGDLEVSIRPPLIYLDHWAVRMISSDAHRRDYFLETFSRRGTLMFSIPNMLEMARNSGESYEQMRLVLDGVGPHWLLSEVNAQAVQERENAGLLPPETFLVPWDLFAVVYKNCPHGTLSLGSALRALQDSEFRERASRILNNSHVVRDLRKARRRYEAGEHMVPIAFPQRSPMWIQVSLLRFLVMDGKKIVENDVTDILHAVVPLRYAVVLLLDKAWANFARKLNLPDTKVFAQPQLDEALDAIRHIDVSRHVVLRPNVPRRITPLK